MKPGQIAYEVESIVRCADKCVLLYEKWGIPLPGCPGARPRGRATPPEDPIAEDQIDRMEALEWLRLTLPNSGGWLVSEDGDDR